MLLHVARVLVLGFYLASCMASHSIKQFCDRNKFKSNDIASLRFTKDLATLEYAAVQRYKSLPCCVAGFTTISWFRDSLPLNETRTTFSEDEDAREIVTTYLRAGDEGMYTCVASNLTHNISHSVKLHVLKNEQYNGPPLAAIRPSDQWAEIGESAQFSCSAFIGFGKNRQLASELYWLRDIGDTEFAEKTGHSESTEFNYSSGGEIKSIIFTIPHVTESDFGPYICIVNNGHPSQLNMTALLHRGVDPTAKTRRSYTAGLVLMSCVLVIAFLLFLTYFTWKVEIHLYWKDRFGKLEDQDGCRYDVFICYSGDESSSVALSLLVPHLENTLNYTCFVYERDMHGGEWMPDVFATKLRESRRFLMLLTPGVIHDPMCRFACQLAVQEALSPRAMRLLCLWAPRPQRQEVLEESSMIESLRIILRVSKKITLRPEDASPKELKKFWCEVRRRLPPRRPGPLGLTYIPLTTTLL